jgi:hypothetical protein
MNYSISDGHGSIATGHINVVITGADEPPFAAVFELSSLLPENGGDGSHGFILNGIDRNDSFS